MRLPKRTVTSSVTSTIKRAGLLFGLLLAGLLVSGGSALAEIVDRVAAVVNKEIITLSEIYDLGGDYIEQVAPGARADAPARRLAELDVLESLIQRRLVAQELDRLGMDVTSEELERSIDDIARQNGMDRQRLRGEVERSGLPWTLYREELEENLRQMKFGQIVLQPRVSYTEDELRDLYKRRVRSLTSSESRSLQAIFLQWGPDATPEERAEVALRISELRARFLDGESWSALVLETTDSVLAGAGGELGTFQRGEAVAEIEGPSFAAEVGGVTEPIAVPNGVLLVRVASASQGEPPSFEDVRVDLEQELMQTKLEQEMELWYTQARRQASVSVRLERPVGF